MGNVKQAVSLFKFRAAIDNKGAPEKQTNSLFYVFSLT